MLGDTLTITAPAKINLLLKVLGKRSDGYHELETVMHQIDLADTLYLRPADDFALYCDDESLPLGEENLVQRAAREMFMRYDLPGGLEVRLEKRIPIGAGLAGGSSDAAAVIRGINQLYDLSLDTSTLCDIGAKIGSDVPFCVIGGTAVARGRGERLETLAEGPRLYLLLCKPGFSLATADVFGAFNFPEPTNSPDLAAFTAAWQSLDIEEIAALLYNSLESASLELAPEIGELKALCWQEQPLGVLMSGSGPTIYAIFNEMATARQAYNRIYSYGYQTWLVRSWRSGKDG